LRLEIRLQVSISEEKIVTKNIKNVFLMRLDLFFSDLLRPKAEGEAKGRAEALADALQRLLAAGISEEQAKKMLGLE
jgi:hypothetical protein